jgi:hypothetical protein
MPEPGPSLLAELAKPRNTTGAIAALFAGVAAAELLEQPKRVRKLLASPDLSDGDLTGLALFLVRWQAESAARDCLLTCLFECMTERKIAHVKLVQFGARVLAAAPPSPLQTAALEYMRTAGRQNEFCAMWVAREFSEDNYAAFCRRSGAPEAPPPPANWREWEEHGWWRVEEDWPIAGLFFELENAEEEVNNRLRRLQNPLIPAAQTLQYFLLHRLWRATATTLARVCAIGDLIREIRNVPGLEPLRDRALLVFRNHWRLLAMGELAEVAAEVYLDLCDLQREFEPDSGKLPPLLEGLDIAHLEKIRRPGNDPAQIILRIRKDASPSSPGGQTSAAE